MPSTTSASTGVNAIQNITINNAVPMLMILLNPRLFEIPDS